MARLDRLQPDSPAKEVRNILLMMTWREWLFGLTEEEFMESHYFRCIVELLNDPKLKELTLPYRLNIKVVLHPFMKNYEKHFKLLQGGGRISVITFDEVLIKD